MEEAESVDEAESKQQDHGKEQATRMKEAGRASHESRSKQEHHGDGRMAALRAIAARQACACGVRRWREAGDRQLAC